MAPAKSDAAKRLQNQSQPFNASNAVVCVREWPRCCAGSGWRSVEEQATGETRVGSVEDESKGRGDTDADANAATVAETTEDLELEQASAVEEPKASAEPTVEEASKAQAVAGQTEPTEPKFSGNFAWFEAYGDDLNAIRPRKTPTVDQYAAIHIKMLSLLAANPSHRPSFFIKTGYRGKPAHLKGPGTLARGDWNIVNRLLTHRLLTHRLLTHRLLMHRPRLVGGCVGAVAFDDDCVADFYAADVDLTAVHGFEARLEAPSATNVYGSGTFKLRRVWQCEDDSEKELYEGWWDFGIETGDRCGRRGKGYRKEDCSAGMIFWAVKFTRTPTADSDEDSEDE